MKRWQTNTAITAGIVLWTFGPLLCTGIAVVIATFCGARLDEPCLLGALDISGIVQVFAMAGWLSILSIPTGLGALVVFILLALTEWRALRGKEAAREQKLAAFRKRSG